MKKSELAAALAAKLDMPKTRAAQIVDTVIETITETLCNDESVTLTGFGTFLVFNRAEREGRNPTTGEPITIAAGKVPKFKPGKMLKEALNK